MGASQAGKLWNCRERAVWLQGPSHTLVHGEELRHQLQGPEPAQLLQHALKDRAQLGPQLHVLLQLLGDGDATLLLLLLL